MLCLRSSLTCGYVVYWSPDAVSENLTAVEVCLSCTCHFVPVSRAFTQISVVFWCSGMLILDSGLAASSDARSIQQIFC